MSGEPPRTNPRRPDPRRQAITISGGPYETELDSQAALGQTKTDAGVD